VLRLAWSQLAPASLPSVDLSLVLVVSNLIFGSHSLPIIPS
jgi:hypothetical protein